jgi:hypothetical protein
VPRFSVWVALVAAIPAFAAVAPSHANESQFRGHGWYVLEPGITDYVAEGPFATKARCMAVADAKSDKIPAKIKATLEKRYPSDWRFYCDYLTGPI